MFGAPLQVDWNGLLPVRDEPPAPPPESAVFQPEALPMQHLQEEIQRLSSHITSGFAAKLPDKGEQLFCSLRLLRDELDRRRLAAIQKDVGEFVRPTQSKNTKSFAFMSLESHLQSALAFDHSEKSENKGDSAFREELRIISQDKLKGTRENAPDFQDGLPLQRDIGPSNMSSSHAGRNLPRRSSKRRKASINRDSTSWEFEKVQDVVLLDDEDVELVHPIQGDDTAKEWKDYKICYPSRDEMESVELSYSDIKCLDPQSYISSPIMNFYIQYLQKSLCPSSRPSIEYYIFNTYFYTKLEEALSSKGDRTASFLKLRRWWKGVNIFQKAYMFLPIHRDEHWSLAIICIPAKEDESGPIILHLDSLGVHSSDQVLTIVDGYLKEEWKYINENAPLPNLPISERIWKYLPRRIEKRKIMVPQQKNDYDCGLFVLYFIERFIGEAPERLRKKDLAMFGRKWFKSEEASGLRRRIRELVIEEFERNKMENIKRESPTATGSPGNDKKQSLLQTSDCQSSKQLNLAEGLDL